MQKALLVFLLFGLATNSSAAPRRQHAELHSVAVKRPNIVVRGAYRFDCYRVERTSSRVGVAPTEVQRPSRRTVTPTIPPHCSRTMYQELRPIQMRAPVETSRSVLSLKPGGQSLLTGVRCLGQRSVTSRQSRYSTTNQVMATTATTKAEVLTIRMGRVARTSAFSRANA